MTNLKKLIERLWDAAGSPYILPEHSELVEAAIHSLEAAEKALTPTDRESLVAEARSENRNRDAEDARRVLGAARMNTPTDDDREALALRAIRAADEADECGDPVIEAWSDGERFTSDDLRTLAAGFRRSEVPEPSAWDQAHAAHWHAGPYCMPEPQGEPSDADAALAIRGLDHLAHNAESPAVRTDSAFARGVIRRLLGERDAAIEVMNQHRCDAQAEAAYRRAVRAESRTQGEPSDAQVDAAWCGWNSTVSTDRMRAALRAAMKEER